MEVELSFGINEKSPRIRDKCKYDINATSLFFFFKKKK